MLASVPIAPTFGPVGDDTQITNTTIKVDFAALSLDTETGGSIILGYHLQMDESDSNFIDIFGADELIDVLSTTASITEPLITEGSTYGFRYRARNTYGWSDWSPTTYLLAASVPSIPDAPTFVSATDNSITVALTFTPDSNGDLFTAHELWMAEGEEDNEHSYTEVTSYLATSQSL